MKSETSIKSAALRGIEQAGGKRIRISELTDHCGGRRKGEEQRLELAIVILGRPVCWEKFHRSTRTQDMDI